MKIVGSRKLWECGIKNRPGKIFIYLPILLSILLIVCSAYAHYDEIIEIDLLSLQPTFENADMEGLVADKQNKAKVFVQIAAPVICFSSFILPDQVPYFHSPNFSSPLSTLILRC